MKHILMSFIKTDSNKHICQCELKCIYNVDRKCYVEFEITTDSLITH